MRMMERRSDKEMIVSAKKKYCRPNRKTRKETSAGTETSPALS